MTDWQAVVGRHAGGMWQTAYRLLNNHDDAADCVQDALLAALQIARREPVRNWAALLSRLVTCRALDRLRRRMRRAAVEDTPLDWAEVASDDAGPVQQAQAAELADRLCGALTELPQQQAEVFCLRYFSRLSYRAIARQLDLRPSAVGVVLHRARGRLQELLEPVVSEEKNHET
ncbi:MAG: sigma-70 family RNA polymerase sigma factor [Planctomycetes bacterium]|nr:sigma-70 family RNA polymerase sigma factor [Planctomycetota bacterium]